MGRKANKPEDVWKFIDKRGEDECWPWKSHHSARGYAIYPMSGKAYRVTRVVCHLRDPDSITIRATPNSADRKLVMHSCDNSGCCNPKHLSVGLQLHNVQDMISKGRKVSPKGEKSFRGKLSHANIERIREARLFGANQKDLAQIYGVSVTSISTALSGHTYGCVPVMHHKSNKAFSEEEKIVVRMQRKGGATIKAIAMLYDVHPATIKRVVREDNV